MDRRLAGALLALLLLTSCRHAGGPATPGTPDAEPPARHPSHGAGLAQLPEPVTVAERFVVDGHERAELDSLAVWLSPEGETRVLVSAKATHQVQVHDGADGRLLQRFGGPGAGPGEFNRPNGLAVHGDLLFVVERDNHRVQVLRLPEFSPVGEFGSDELQAPYGLWIHELAPDRLEAIITDSFMLGERYDVVPPLEALHQRLHRYHVDTLEGALSAAHRGSFGETDARSAIRMTESIWGDPLHERLLVADEHLPSGVRLRVYGLQGGDQRRDLGVGLFAGEPEGIALWACADGSGYWIATDQQVERTAFLVFDRESLVLAGRFQGERTANTDGIALQAVGDAAFPGGALYAVHDDRGIAAFDWTEVAAALGLRPRCME